MTHRSEIETTLNDFPEVRWDRFSVVPPFCVGVFGWLDRPDGRHDFVVFKFEHGWLQQFITSSPAFHQKLSEHYDLVGDFKCQRVEHGFPAVLNVIRLKAATPTLSVQDKNAKAG